MGISNFWKKRKRKVKRQPTSEQLSRNAELKRQRFMSDAYIELARKDPDLKRQMIAETFGLKLASKDPVAEQQKEFETLIFGMVMKNLRENPETAEKIVQARISQLTNEGGPVAYGGDEEYHPDSTIGQVLNEIEDLEELKNRLGSSSGSALSNILGDPQVIKSLLDTIRSTIKGFSPQATGSMIMVQVDGHPTTVSESDYLRLQQEGRVRPLAIVEPPKPEKSPGAKEVASGPITQDKPTEPVRDSLPEKPGSSRGNEPQLPLIFQLVDPAAFVSYLGQSPAEVVKELETQKLADPYADLLWNYLATVDFGSLTQALVAYEGHRELGPHVRQLLSDEGEKWLSGIIELIKQKANNNGPAL